MTFGRSTWNPPPRLRDREPPEHVSKSARSGVYSSCGGDVVVRAKEPDPVRDEAHRRRVAGLPCFACRIQGYSQAAHPNTGKAKGKKLSDADCFPLCCARLGVKGCHAQFDQYELVPRAAMPEFEQRALEWTRQQLEMTA